MRYTQKQMREIAGEARDELGLRPFERLDPYALCELHGIAVYAMTDGAAEVVQHFTSTRPSAWSAMLVPIGSSRIIIENDTHVLVRRRSNIAHELGHHLLEHSFDEVLLGDDHQRQFDERAEKEAKFISGELLIPEVAAKRAAFDGLSNQQVGLKFGVSEQFAQMQLAGPRKYAAHALRNQMRGRAS
jgi:hypothetical protein